MAKKLESPVKHRLSPTQTVRNLSEDFVQSLDIPSLPTHLPQRLEEAINGRVDAWLYQLREAKKRRFVKAIEVRLVRDAHRAVLTAYELGLRNAETNYATFRELVEELGYERTDVGFAKGDPPE